MDVSAFITHKKAEHFTDCQDRFSVNFDTKSIAVSDGMGSTWQQKIWAEILSKHFTDNPNWLPIQKEDIHNLTFLWRTRVCEFIEKLKEENAPQNIIYRNERNLAEGKSAGATLVGIRFSDENWKGIVLGDSCLIEWDGSIAKFYTSQDSSEFDSFPDYFDSNPLKDGRGKPKIITGTLTSNTTLLLVSDPFSEFLLEKHNKGIIKEYIKKLIDLTSHEDFETLAFEWRAEGMHNDDTTVVIVKPSNSIESFDLKFIDNIDELIVSEQKKIKAAEEAKRKVDEDIVRRKAEEDKRKAQEELERENQRNAEISKSMKAVAQQGMRREEQITSKEGNNGTENFNRSINVSEDDVVLEVMQLFEHKRTYLKRSILQRFCEDKLWPIQSENIKITFQESVREVLQKYTITNKSNNNATT